MTNPRLCKRSIIDHITGISLYQEKIETTIILEMNGKIQECSYDQVMEFINSFNANGFFILRIDEEEWKSFQKMWDAHAKSGHYLVGWW